MLREAQTRRTLIFTAVKISNLALFLNLSHGTLYAWDRREMHKTLDGQPDGKRRHSISRHKWEVNVQDERKDVGTIWR